MKTTFVKILSPREMRKDKVEELTNLKKGSMLVREYSLMFVKLLRYVTSPVSKSRDKMSRFITGFIGNLEEDCLAAMPYNNMDLSMLMVHIQ